MDRRKGERRQLDRRKPSPGVVARRSSAMPALTPGQENAQGPTQARQAAEAFLRKDRPLRSLEQMPVEMAGESGARARPIVAARAQHRPSTHVSGPSFLGLDDTSPGSADYLLEDEPRSGLHKLAVLLLLILIGVLAYMQWKTNWRIWPASPLPTQSAPPANPPQGSAAPANDATGALTAQQASAQPDPAPAQPPASHEPAATADDKARSDEPAAADKSPDKGEAAAGPAVSRAAAPDTQPDPMVVMAQKYLYGRGVRRDCEQAMVYLRAANQKANAQARSQMGALYATGYCVPLDRVRAYQWFTSALNVEPGNTSLQHERNNLWAQMSSGERQQAVK